MPPPFRFLSPLFSAASNGSFVVNCLLYGTVPVAFSSLVLRFEPAFLFFLLDVSKGEKEREKEKEKLIFTLGEVQSMAVR